MADTRKFARKLIDDSIAAGQEAAKRAPKAAEAAELSAKEMRRRERLKVRVQTAETERKR